MDKALKPESVLIVTTGYPRFEGDLFGNFIKDYALHLKKEMRVRVLAPHQRGLPFKSIEEGVEVFRMPYFPFLEQVAYGDGIMGNLKKPLAAIQLPFFMVAMQAWTLILSRPAQVVHAQWSVSGLWAWVNKVFTQKPFVVTFRGSDLHTSGKLLQLSKWVSEKSDGNITVAEGQIKLLSSNGKTTTIPNPIDTHRFSPVGDEKKRHLRNKYHIPNEALVCLTVGRLIPLKRVDAIMRWVHSKAPNLEMLIVGEGSELTTLSSLAHKLNLKARFTGSVDYSEIHELFQLSDFFTLGSTNEGRPNVLYQAMACGLACLATPVGGIPEMIVHHESGLLFDILKDDYGIALARLSTDKELRVKLGHHARTRISNMDVEPDKVVESHLRVYQQALCIS